MAKVLVTGAAGFIGSHTTERLLARGDEVVGLDSFSDFYDPDVKRRNLAAALESKAFRLAEADIEDAGAVEAVFDAHAIDRVVHLAARAGVRPSIENPRAYFATNVMGTVNLLESCRARGVRTFVFASSSSVYGECETAPFREDLKIDSPVSPYAASKKAGELIVYNYHRLFGMDAACLRFFTVYGPRQRPEMAIHRFVRLIEEERPIQLFGAGDTSRDYTYVDDIVDGALAALDRCAGYNVYNLGRSDPVSLADLVAAIEKAVGKKARVERRPPQPGDVSRTFADISRARRDLGYDPKVSLAEGLARFVAWRRGGR